jgi:ATP-binding cassette subfamily B protein
MSPTRQILKVYWQHAWRYPKLVLGLLLTVPLATISFRLLPPFVAATILRRLSQGDYIPGNVWGSFGHQIVLYAIVTILGGIGLWRLVSYLIWNLEGRVVRDLYRTMFNHLMIMDSAFHSNTFGGSLVSQTNKLVGSYIRLQDTLIFQVYGLFISLLFIAITLYSRATLFVWALLGFSALFIVFSIVLSKRVRELSAIEAKAHNKATGVLADAITNVMAVKSFASTKSENKRYAQATEYTRQRTMDTMRASIKRDFFASTITTSVQITAVFISVIAVVAKDANVATVFLMLSYSTMIADRLWEFSANVVRNYNRSMGDAQEAIATLNTPPSVKDPDVPEPSRIISGAIDINNMDFTHEEVHERESLFKNFDLHIKPGEKIGLVGHSGSGKTSLTRLLQRYMDIDEGEILIDGQNIAHIKQDELREALAYVPQEPLLFHRSIKENIAYGKPSATDEEIIKVAQQAHAHEFVKDLPQGYDTLVGERGVKLSGGQRQRIAIARAMIKNAPILVLDEATSALDSESELLIQDALWKLMEKRTAIVIAHRLSTIQRMDRIVVLDDGKIVEQGSHKDLLAKKGVYARLWRHQSGGFINEDA